MEPRVGLAFGDWLTGCTAFLVKQSIYRNKKVICFGLLMWYLRQEQLHLGPSNLFQQYQKLQNLVINLVLEAG